jgi:hypothetical protein
MEMKRTFVFVLCLGLAGLAFGQPRTARPRPTRDILRTSAGLLASPAVQKELALSAATSKAINDKLGSVMRTMASPGRKDMTAEQRRLANQELGKKLDKAQADVVGMLSASQKARLKQIGIQRMGAGAILHPEISTSLGITPAQKSKVSAIVEKNTSEMFKVFRGSGKQQPTREEMRKRLGEFNKNRETIEAKSMKECNAVLSAGQRSKWAALRGKPFKLQTGRT